MVGSSTPPKSESGPYSPCGLHRSTRSKMEEDGRKAVCLWVVVVTGMLTQGWFILGNPKAVLLCDLHTLAGISKACPQCSNCLCILVSIQAFCVHPYYPALPKKNVHFDRVFLQFSLLLFTFFTIIWKPPFYSTLTCSPLDLVTGQNWIC